MKNQSHQLLCNLRNGQDYLFAVYCDEKGEGHLFSHYDVKVEMGTSCNK